MSIPTSRPVLPWRAVLWGAAALLLCLPWVAMQFTSSVRWGLADFAVFGGMLVIACGAFEAAVRLTANRGYRWMAGVAIAMAFLLVWVELAVGVVR